MLTISPETAEERIISRNPSEWINMPEAVKMSVNELLETQNMLREQAKRSKVPTREINTDDKDWNRCVRIIMEGNNNA
ncbi:MULTISPECIES: hypothetical protein [Paenibacillus]|uniref:hypothetical protein n=1 Tax=Paenibacillus TaxID=44249 RepID=UPI001EEAC215|nr:MULTISPECIES: hypothetical protein [Paenibacillus]